MPTAEPNSTAPSGGLGVRVSDVVIDVDYAIIEHFSKHLYHSPNKAVEEMVSNAFDAFASRTYVYLPGRLTRDRVAVWDDGTSMDVAHLQEMWSIGRSTKRDRDRTAAAGGSTRKLIGKFGIGKLASYSVGDRITHLCRGGSRFLLLSVDYRELRSDLDDRGPGSAARSVNPVLSLSEAEAAGLAASWFPRGCRALTELWDTGSWTLAVIDELSGAALSPKRLRWVLGNGMPVRPDFRVEVDDEPVVARTPRGATAVWDLGEPRVAESLANAWTEAAAAGEVAGSWQVEDAPRPDWPASGPGPVLRFPRLGAVRAELRLFPRSLEDARGTGAGRAHGFFLLVRDRLVNPDDPLLLLPSPSWATLYRLQVRIWADNLDDELLADRERLRSDTARSRELRTLQAGLYRAAFAELERQDNRRLLAARPASLLPAHSRELFRAPLNALLLRRDLLPDAAFDLTDPGVERQDLAASDPVAVVRAGDPGFRVNTAHPFFVALQKRLGRGQRAQEALRAFDLLAVGERLLEGFLYDEGIADRRIDAVLRWRDQLLRALAVQYADSPEEVVREVLSASYAGAARFENALADLFASMGFVATRSGRSGTDDVLVLGPTGTTSTRFTIEAKGSHRAVANDGAEIAGAAAHRDAAGATHAIVVARSFAGFQRGQAHRAAVLAECRSVGGVSVATVQTLVELHDAVRRFSYPLNLILPVLAVVEPPEDKRRRVAELAQPVDHFDYRELLEDIWRRQQEEAQDNVVAYRSVWQSRPEWRREMSFEEFTAKLIALEVMSRGLIRLSTDTREIELVQAPVIIADKIQRGLRAA